MKRHYANYFKGVANFKETRTKLVTSNDINELFEVLDSLKERADQYSYAHHVPAVQY